MQTRLTDELPCLRGLVTDRDLALAEEEFPGISGCYASHRGQCRTFLDLLALYLDENHDIIH